LDEAVKALMLSNEGYGINFELTTPDKLTMAVMVKPEEMFSYDTTKSKHTEQPLIFNVIDGEYQLCMRIADAVFADQDAGIKSIKTKLFFSNEYYSCMWYLCISFISYSCRQEKEGLNRINKIIGGRARGRACTQN